MASKRKRAAQRPSPQTRLLPNGNTLSIAPDAAQWPQQVPGHGFILLRAATLTAPDGRSWHSTAWDLSHVEPPKGALRADPHLQVFGLGGPKLWYLDEQRSCVQCGAPFVFSAAEQRYWYETLGFHESSTAVRCAKCRRQGRTLVALNRQLALTLAAVEASPESPNAWLELARVSVELRRMKGVGDLDRGISAARKAWSLSEEQLPEALYLESVMQGMSGREDKAVALEDQFLAASTHNRRLRPLRQAIEDRRAGRDR